MNEQDPKKESPQPQAEEKEPVKSFVPELVKKPQFQPPKFKYIPPKGSKRHF